MKLVIIFGPPAVGKMTVGRELSKITGLKLFHNHMSLELVNNFFDFSTAPFRRLDKEIRFVIFREVASSDLEGLIFTFVWAIDYQTDSDYIKEIVEIFELKNGEVYYVGLRAELSERLVRNKQEDRLLAKPSKRDIEFSEKNLLKLEKEKLNTEEGDLQELNILKVDNTKIDAKEV